MRDFLFDTFRSIRSAIRQRLEGYFERRPNAMALAVLILGALSLPSCGCDDVGCHDGFVVTVHPTNPTRFQLGEYVFHIDEDGTDSECKVIVREIQPDLSEGPCQIVSGPKSISLRLSRYPENVSIRMTYEERELFFASFSPVYESYSIDGMCGDSCRIAMADVDVALN